VSPAGPELAGRSSSGRFPCWKPTVMTIFEEAPKPEFEHLLTDKARQAFALGFARAREDGAAEFNGLYLLYGILSLRTCTARTILRVLAGSIEPLEAALLRVLPRSRATGEPSRPVESAEIRGILRSALELARGSGPIGTGHLLLPVAREGNGVAELLEGVGISLPALHRAVARHTRR